MIPVATPYAPIAVAVAYRVLARLRALFATPPCNVTHAHAHAAPIFPSPAYPPSTVHRYHTNRNKKKKEKKEKKKKRRKGGEKERDRLPMGDPGDGATRPRARRGGGGGDSYTAWDQFLTHALKTRLEPDRFADFAPLLSARHALGPGPVADLFLRPSAWNTYTLDPRIPLYLQTLLDLRLVDMQAVLAGLFRYSTAHTVVGGKNGEQGGGGVAVGVGVGAEKEKEKGMKSQAVDEGEGKGDEVVKKKTKNRKTEVVVRWQSSFTSEEVIFYRLRQAVTSGAIRNSKDALEVCVIIARWMMIFTAASVALLPEHDEDVIMGGIAGAGSATKKTRDDMENSRAAFVMMLLGVCEHPVVLQALTKPLAKSEYPHLALVLSFGKLCDADSRTQVRERRSPRASPVSSRRSCRAPRRLPTRAQLR